MPLNGKSASDDGFDDGIIIAGEASAEGHARAQRWDEATRYEEFMAQERAKFAAEQTRRRQCANEMIVTAEALVEAEQQQAAQLPNDTSDQEFDPWMNVLQTVETRAGVVHVFDVDGNREFRVSSRYLLTSVIGAEPERTNWSSASIRLGRLMRRLGWNGPKDLRLKEVKARGYSKVDSARAKAA